LTLCTLVRNFFFIFFFFFCCCYFVVCLFAFRMAIS
jgi:hypothetical protein